jgi:ferric-dicitrate binding protein FerR (iron transport regulator)
MGTPPLHKNGQEQAYKQELRSLRETLEKDAEAHTLILAKLTVYETEIKVANARSEEKDKAEKSLRRQIGALFLLFMSSAAGIVGWGIGEARDIRKDISANTAHFREFQAIGIEWGDAIDERAAGFKEDIRQLRHKIDGRHRPTGQRE